MTKRDSPGPSSSEPPRKRPLSIDANGKPRFRGCDSIKAYDILEKLGEGTFGYVCFSLPGEERRGRVNGRVGGLDWVGLGGGEFKDNNDGGVLLGKYIRLDINLPTLWLP